MFSNFAAKSLLRLGYGTGSNFVEIEGVAAGFCFVAIVNGMSGLGVGRKHEG